MKKISCKVLAILLCICMSLTIVACGKKGSSKKTESTDQNSQTAKEDAKEVTLEFWTYADIAQGAGLEYLNRCIKKFQETHPNVKVNITGKGDDDLLASLITAAQSNTMPDVFEQSTRDGAQMVEAGVLNNIYDRWMSLSDDYRAQFNPDLIKLVTPKDGVMYALPHTGFGAIMYRNLNVLEKAGIDPEDKPKTWDEWLAQMEKISAVGCKSIPNFAAYWWGFACAYGGIGTREEWAIDFENNKTMMTEEHLAKTAEFVAKTKPHASELPVFDQGTSDLFISNGLAFYISGSWSDPTFKAATESSGLKYDWALIPGATAERHGGVSGYELISIATENKNVDLAWEFCTFMTDYDQMYDLGETLGRYNSNAKAMNNCTNPLIAITNEATVGQTYNQAPFFVEPWPSEYYPILTDNVLAIYNGEISAVDGAKKAIKELNEYLKNR